MAKSTRQSVCFPDLFGKPTVAIFDAEAQTSDGGGALLGAADRRLGLTERMARCLVDGRDGSRVVHTLQEILQQRVFSMALGYEDQNDAARIGADPVLKGLVGRAPVSGVDLASQPTLSRFENGASARELLAMTYELEDVCIERLRARHRRPRLITIDLDPTVDPTHGAQQLTFFNAFYDTHCYLPLVGVISVAGSPEQHLFCARLRPGNAPAARGVIPIIRRMVRKLRAAFPGTKLRVRLDSGYGYSPLLDVLDELGVLYVVGLPTNPRLERLCSLERAAAAMASSESGESERFFGEFRYAAESWSRERRVVVKAEVLVHEGRTTKDNPRFVVTNIPRRRGAEEVYTLDYCGRGDMENRIKELKYGLEADRLSCSSYCANQFRLLMTAMAYVLFEELRAGLRGTEAARWQVTTLRERLLKVGARVVESVRRVVLHLAAAHPWRQLWCRVARRLGAQPG